MRQRLEGFGLLNCETAQMGGINLSPSVSKGAHLVSESDLEAALDFVRARAAGSVRDSVQPR